MKNVLIIFVLPSLSSSFNLDSNSSRIIRGEDAGAWFGYSVAIRGLTPDMKLLIGAPKSNSARDVENGGAVYKCSSTRNYCTTMKEFDVRFVASISKLDNQLLGATLATSSYNDDILVCAPMYKEFLPKDHSGIDINEYYPCGRCLQYTQGEIKDLGVPRANTRQSPERHSYLYRSNYGFGMMGFSAALANNSTGDVYVGVPGKNRAQGTLLHIHNDGQKKISPAVEDQQVFTLYSGYATTAGDFNGDGLIQSAASIPRTRLGMGAVVIYDNQLKPWKQLNGTQLGSYFGYCLAAADFNGDGGLKFRVDDLIVGEPMYSKHTNESGTQVRSEYAVGKVTVFLQGNQQEMSDVLVIYGMIPFSQFGTSLANAGDLNKDGYEDFVVGAPYEGLGAIYIVMGSTLKMITYSQKIEASALDSNLKSFGFSVAAGQDIDGNEYPDILVGAYESDRVVVIRSRPIIEMVSNIQFDKEYINLNDKLCGNNGTRYSCLTLTACFRYTGIAAPWKTDFDVLFEFDVNQTESNKRILQTKITDVFQLRRGSQLCKTKEMFIKNNIQDKFNPIAVVATFTIKENDRMELLRPILDPSQDNKLSKKIEISKPCGSDNYCTPDLQLFVQQDDDFIVYGTSEPLQMRVTVHNQLENAYSAQLIVQFPSNIHFVGYEEQYYDKSVTCREVTNPSGVEENAGIICKLGNPLVSQKKVKLTLEFFRDYNYEDEASEIFFEFYANSTNVEDSTYSDNYKSVTIPIKYETKFFTGGVSLPDTYVYDYSKINNIQFDFEAGPIIIHQFEIRNDGHTSWKGAEITVLWPSFTEDGSNLLYLIQEPETEGDVTCTVTPQDNINPNSLTIDPSGSNEYKSTSTDTNLNPKVQAGSFFALSSSLIFSQDTFDKYAAIIPNTICTRNCTKIHCSSAKVLSGASVVVRIVSRLWLNTILDYSFITAKVTSAASVQINPFRGNAPAPQFIKVDTSIHPKRISHIYRPVEWWIYLVAAIGGLLILAIFIFILYKRGFFRRNNYTERKQLQQEATLDQQQEMAQFAEPETPGYTSNNHFDPQVHGTPL